MAPRICRECGHADIHRGRDNGRCAVNVARAGRCCCSCVYGDSVVLVRVRDLGQFLMEETDGGALLTPDRAKAARLTLDGARWFERRCPFAVDIEVLA